MPVQIASAQYYDNFGGGPFNSYRSNAGDRFELRIVAYSVIRISSLNSPLTLDPSINEITIAGGSWIEEGFRIGDTATVTIYTVGGSVITTFTTTVSYVDNVILDVTSCPSWYNQSLGEFAVISLASRDRADLDVMFNHVSNNNGGQEFSLIDGEATRLSFPAAGSLAVSSSLNALIVGNQSGQFVSGATITRNANTAQGQRQYTISVRFENSGIYDQDWFNSSDCLKTYTRLIWASLSGETQNLNISVHQPMANTGWFNEANNASVTDAVLVSGIPEIDYQVGGTYSIVVDGPLAGLGIGAAYVPQDEAYYKNKPQSQRNLAMIVQTQAATGTLTSAANPSGASYTFGAFTVVTVGTVHTITFTFTPNAAFTTFMDSRDEDDRLFYVWVKCGNLNLLAYAAQMTAQPPIGAPITMLSEVAFYDHSQNVNDGSGTKQTNLFDTEDDLAYFGSFLLDKGQQYEKFTARVEAFNTTSLDDFTLQEVIFDFSTVPFSNDGRYLLNQTINVVLSLPGTSFKRAAVLKLEPTLDTVTEYGVSIYFPVLLRWEYWLPQLNANVDFVPNQNKNWQQYNALGDWQLRMELELMEDGLARQYHKQIIDRVYNADNDIVSTVQLIRESTGAIVNIIIEGEQMRVRSTHQLLTAWWDQPEVWGMITIEPYESAPRLICSTVVPYDPTQSNPLAPITGTFASLTFLAPDVAQIECFLNPNVINLQNGVKITAKIKGCTIPAVLGAKTMTDGTVKETTNNDIKTVAP
jgi:hypothetical protein